MQVYAAKYRGTARIPVGQDDVLKSSAISGVFHSPNRFHPNTLTKAIVHIKSGFITHWGGWFLVYWGGGVLGLGGGLCPWEVLLFFYLI